MQPLGSNINIRGFQTNFIVREKKLNFRRSENVKAKAFASFHSNYAANKQPSVFMVSISLFEATALAQELKSMGHLPYE